jgi:putative addiction module component (TIGR02574 family)
MWRTLEDITRTKWLMRELRHRWSQVHSYPFPDLPMAVVIQRSNLSQHYIAVHGDLVYDPLFEMPQTRTNYLDGGSWVRVIFAPKESGSWNMHTNRDESPSKFTGDIWESLTPIDEFEIPESHREELDRRLAAADAEPEAGKPWEEVRARLRGEK